ncbi:MAG: response regulator [Elusimicrobia bacterium]|nr:response regulator [Elusimicrobiota bacterium]
MKPLILVIDDMKDERKLVRLLLRQYDCELAEAAGAEEGLVAARKRTPNLILIDHTMPQMKGYEAVAEFRTDPALCRVPVIMLSSRKFDPCFKDYMSLQGVTFLAKPVQAGALVSTIGSLIGALAPAPKKPALASAATAAACRV